MDRLWMILIGGLMPAFAFGLAAIFQKAAAVQGLGAGTYLLCAGLVMAVGGALSRLVLGESWAFDGAGFAALGGACFALGLFGISFAVLKLNAPLSLLAPITVFSTLVTVTLSFLIFKEYKDVAAIRLLAGALLVTAGAALVATS